MRIVDLILDKRAGKAHSPDEIHAIITGYVNGDIPDYQMSAWMMAVCFSGMNAQEITELTRAMTYSGDIVDLADLPGVKVDKHSTGGVGDTTTLIIAPLVAACGGTVAKMTGRGLGHTGGTLDKLESVPGINVEQSIEDFKRIVRKTGLCVMGASKDIVPADKLMYALRDVTGTVKSVPLISSSIMSKKIAAGTDAILLDVKTGSGAFMQTVDEARELARTMVEIGHGLGRKTVAVITDMNQPLGLAVGNGLEMKDAIDLLSGRIPESDPLYEVCMLLAENMLLLGGVPDEGAARIMLKHAISSGAGLDKLESMLREMGGDTACIRDPELLVQVRERIPVRAERAGFIGDMHAERIGMAAQMLGAGRATKEDKIDPAVGLIMHKRRGDRIDKGEPLATLYVNDGSRLKEAVATLRSGMTVTDEKPARTPIVYGMIK